VVSYRFIPVGYAFFSAGWLGASHGQAFTCVDVSDFQSMVHVPGNLPRSWKKCLWRSLRGGFRLEADIAEILPIVIGRCIAVIAKICCHEFEHQRQLAP
jgi:hypothetical protein